MRRVKSVILALGLGIFALAAGACGLGAVAPMAPVTVATAHPPFVGWWDSASPAGTVVVLPADVLFAVDSSALSPAALASLRPLAGQLAGFGGQVAVIGFTDDTGSTSHNQRLSLQRAQAVQAAFVSMGVTADRVTAIGRGSSDPVATNKTAAGRSENRRVEINYFAPRSDAAEASQ